ncbi:5-formyltetrahydrofolate cyclo-ligase [Thalassospira sp. MA62]|nr:5-formyltetrahydrofolate cyclo-ligase [Thalassospira sp. MA62]
MFLDLPSAPNSSDIKQQTEWRNAVRRALLGWRSSLDRATHAEFSSRVRVNFSDFLTDYPRCTVGFYWPIQNEIDLRPAIESHLAGGGRAALPVVPGKDQPMRFHDWTAETEMTPGFACIPEPLSTAPADVDVLLAPLVGFDDAGYRLGYGGGFFDRTLAAMDQKPVVVGVGFEATRLEDINPHQYDIPADVIITEQGIQRIASR